MCWKFIERYCKKKRKKKEIEGKEGREDFPWKIGEARFIHEDQSRNIRCRGIRGTRSIILSRIIGSLSESRNIQTSGSPVFSRGLLVNYPRKIILPVSWRAKIFYYVLRNATLVSRFNLLHICIRTRFLKRERERERERFLTVWVIERNFRSKRRKLFVIEEGKKKKEKNGKDRGRIIFASTKFFFICATRPS